ncbi:phosphatidylinositol N-acetylglucosaminyltransferase SPT14 [Ascoidea rubescens DSM 1968]|uniref:Phosphatidylinositol N-acetylglucosaminyltransferase GPI3 subunit n=1 Tax=Ascoidea rubescens DSM 1968 TaxID=1344418 RepID=A0A1D2VMC7_9ASCO|nr:glycosyltransferase family 4 protein [Ascoidea rubescens DSM 1968]ODV62705.1 glycosyltransferase family 4 protein [Ascoidea rubescens DSM 1968]
MSYNIAMVSDFFYPQMGGVELHIYHLSQQLIQLGYSVVIITHDYKSRIGIRYLTNGLKVYYVPFFILFRESTFPTVFSAFPILRNIFIRENINLVHGHGSLSSLCHEAIFHARTMGIKAVFTDHSLFGFADIGSILANKALKFTLKDINRVICVSHTCKENTVLRASINPNIVYVIPNAVISQDFRPDLSKMNRKLKQNIKKMTNTINNNSADLLVKIIPIICSKNSKVRFLIAGDGPKFIDLVQMIEMNRLQERVELIGEIRHEQVRDVMCKGDIYLHASLTEAFGTVLVEAASCNLLVVTTRVGGIPEVLPNYMTVFANPSVNSLVENCLIAIEMIDLKKIDTSVFHDEIKKMYDWIDVARRTELVYNSIREDEVKKPLYIKFQIFYNSGLWAGKLYLLCVVVDIFILFFLNVFYPVQNIDRVRKWPKKKVYTLKYHHLSSPESE